MAAAPSRSVAPRRAAPFRFEGGLVQWQVAWPGDHTGWRLQMNTNLATGSWQDIVGTDSTNAVSLLPTNGNTFFRLVYP